jgi:hypothetical protein
MGQLNGSISNEIDTIYFMVIKDLKLMYLMVTSCTPLDTLTSNPRSYSPSAKCVIKGH